MADVRGLPVRVDDHAARLPRHVQRPEDLARLQVDAGDLVGPRGGDHRDRLVLREREAPRVRRDRDARDLLQLVPGLLFEDEQEARIADRHQDEPVQGEDLRGRAGHRDLLLTAGVRRRLDSGDAARKRRPRGKRCAGRGARARSSRRRRHRGGARRGARGGAPGGEGLRRLLAEREREDAQAMVVLVGEVEPRPVGRSHERAAAALGGLDVLVRRGGRRGARRAEGRRGAGGRAAGGRAVAGGEEQGGEADRGRSGNHARAKIRGVAGRGTGRAGEARRGPDLRRGTV